MGTGCRGMFICSKLRQNLSDMEVRTFVRIQRVIWDHLLAFKADIFQKQQWATKAVETLLGNDAFRYLSICSILFASSVNPLIPPAPQFNFVQALWSVQSKKQKNQHCFGGKGGNVTKMLKINFITKCLNTFVAHCRLFGSPQF